MFTVVGLFPDGQGLFVAILFRLKFSLFLESHKQIIFCNFWGCRENCCAEESLGAEVLRKEDKFAWQKCVGYAEWLADICRKKNSILTIYNHLRKYLNSENCFLSRSDSIADSLTTYIPVDNELPWSGLVPLSSLSGAVPTTNSIIARDRNLKN